MQSDRARNLMTRYKLTEEAYEKLLTGQDACAICRRPWDDDIQPNVDHHRASGAVRELLCRGCNVGLGHFQESVVRLLRAAIYLLKHPSGGYT
jgi:hypothetical protein